MFASRLAPNLHCAHEQRAWHVQICVYNIATVLKEGPLLLLFVVDVWGMTLAIGTYA